MSMAVEIIRRMCRFCGRWGNHLLRQESRIFRGTLVVNRTYTCIDCGGKERE